MYGLKGLALVAASIVAPLVGASSISEGLVERQSASSWFLPQQAAKGQGLVPSNPSYKVFRDVTTFGAKGDGQTDDTDAINKAIAAGGSCVPTQPCDSTTTAPGLIYFPPGKYLVKAPIIQAYFTQLVGDVINPPTLVIDSSFKGMGVIDSDPYKPDGSNVWTNQNNFYRQVRNFIIDMKAGPSAAAGIHWQVAQATSLQNIDFQMAPGSKQTGIFMDNGSGGFMADLTFSGGNIGAFFGNQQFTTRNLSFKNMNTAIFMNWNWLWTLKNVNVANDVGTAVNMTNGGPTNGQVGSVILQDSTIQSKIGIATSYSPQSKASNGTLIIDNVDFTGCGTPVNNDAGGSNGLAQSSVVPSWIQGATYTSGSTQPASAGGQKYQQGPLKSPTRPANLLKGTNYFSQSKRQFETVKNTINMRDAGAKGDGVTDDSAAIQKALDSATSDSVVYFPHGNYLIKNPLVIKTSVNIVGEVWPVLMADGPSFGDESNPKPVIQVGTAGSTNDVQIIDMVIGTSGSAKGAILVEWNSKGSGIAGAHGMWDTHTRIGGWTGSKLQSDTCSRADALAPQPINDACFGAFLMFHMKDGSSGYFENVWWWVADHELDLPKGNQLNIYNGRGVLIESSQGPTWLYGTASEHSQLYNFAFNKAANVYVGAVQTETAYMQGGKGAPQADQAFKPNTLYADPDFSECANDNTGTCKMTWGVRVTTSSNILIYGAGFYSFFNNYDQHCLKSGGGSDNCQTNMVFVDECSTDILFYGLSTKAAVNMLTIGGVQAIEGAINPSTFCETVALAEVA